MAAGRASAAAAAVAAAAVLLRLPAHSLHLAAASLARPAGRKTSCCDRKRGRDRGGDRGGDRSSGSGDVLGGPPTDPRGPHDDCWLLGAASISKKLKVTLLGAAGTVGQPLALLLKQSALLDELALYDIRNTAGMALDLAHVDTRCRVLTFTGEQQLAAALQGSQLVIMLAGARPQPDTTREQHFLENAELVKELASAAAKHAPTALLAVMTTPVNCCTVVADAMSTGRAGRVFGVTAMDSTRANSMLATLLGLEPEKVLVPVVGGAGGESAVPLFSKSQPRSELTQGEVRGLTAEMQRPSGSNFSPDAGDCFGSMCASFAAARFALSLCRGLCGHENVAECGFTRCDAVPDCPFLSMPLVLGPGGVQRVLSLGGLTEYESWLLLRAIAVVRRDVNMALQYLEKGRPAKMLPCGSAPPCPVGQQQLLQVAAGAPPLADVPALQAPPGRSGEAKKGEPKKKKKEDGKVCKKGEKDICGRTGQKGEKDKEKMKSPSPSPPASRSRRLVAMCEAAKRRRKAAAEAAAKAKRKAERTGRAPGSPCAPPPCEAPGLPCVPPCVPPSGLFASQGQAEQTDHESFAAPEKRSPCAPKPPPCPPPRPQRAPRAPRTRTKAKRPCGFR